MCSSPAPAAWTTSNARRSSTRSSRFPGIEQVLAKGDNKVSFKLRNGLQVDVRTLSPDSYGAGLQYFTGSKSHSVALRQRALKMGLTLNEYGLSRLKRQQVGRGQDRGRHLPAR